MKRYIPIVLLLFCLSNSFGQKILVMENVISQKNFKYYNGNRIILKIAGDEKKVHDEILDLSDSAVFLSLNGEVRFSEIEAVYRENWLVRTLQGLSLIGGVAYFGVDSFNRLINNDSPVVLKETLIISGSMVAFSFALMPARYRKFKTGEKWRFKMIDPSAL